MTRRILISNGHLKEIGGSELVTAELAEEYVQRGWQVLIYTPRAGAPMLNSIDPRVQVTGKLPDLGAGWDIVWDHHNVLMRHLVKRKGQLIVANHMSSYVDMERPKYPPGFPDRIFGNSQETINAMGFDYAERAELMQNPAPRWTTNIAPGFEGLFISKHRPPELEHAISQLAVKSMVMNGERRIQRWDFNRAQFVVCNGKSVQYALVCGIPVFLYDHFGGPGWLTEENFEKAAYYNFSGRGFESRPDTVESLFAYASIPPIPMERVNWRYRLSEWLYHMELV